MKTYFFPEQPPELAGQLWPPAPFEVGGHLASGWAKKNKGQYGDERLSPGALRRANDGVTLEVLGSGPTGSDWGSFVGALGSLMYYRYGPGWWAYGRLDAHDFAQGYYKELSAKDPMAWPPRIRIGDGPPRFPGDAPLEDVSFDKSLYDRVKEAHLEAFPPSEPTPKPTPPTPQKPPAPPAPIPQPEPPKPTPTPAPAAPEPFSARSLDSLAKLKEFHKAGTGMGKRVRDLEREVLDRQRALLAARGK